MRPEKLAEVLHAIDRELKLHDKQIEVYKSLFNLHVEENAKLQVTVRNLTVYQTINFGIILFLILQNFF